MGWKRKMFLTNLKMKPDYVKLYFKNRIWLHIVDRKESNNISNKIIFPNKLSNKT